MNSVEFLLFFTVFVQVFWIVSLLLETFLQIIMEPKERHPNLWYLFKCYVRMPWYQIWVFLFGGDYFEPSLYIRLKLTLILLRDELYVRQRECHYSVSSFYQSATKGFYPILWFQHAFSKCKHESFGAHLLSRYQRRLCIRREIAHETDTVTGWDGFRLRQRLWYTYRFFGERNYYFLKHKLLYSQVAL